MARIDFDLNNTDLIYDEKPPVKPDIQTVIDHLKSVLPPLESLTTFKPKQHEAPCPCCGGNTRFRIKGNRAYCSSCMTKGGDVIDWHLKINNLEAGKPYQLLKYYPIHDHLKYREKLKQQQQKTKAETEAEAEKAKNQDDSKIKMIQRWSRIFNAQISQDAVYSLLVDRRMLTPETVAEAINGGKLRLCKHCNKDSIAVPYFSLQGKEPDHLCSMQYITIDGAPFEFTVDKKTGEGKNKVFNAGATHDDGFFHAGLEINEATKLVIVESVIDALSISEYVEDVCCLATGSTSYAKKLNNLTPYLSSLETITIFQDNDAAGEKFATEAAGILGDKASDKLYKVQWSSTDKAGYDANDLIKDAQENRIKQMIDTAVKTTLQEEAPEEAPEPILFCSFADIYKANPQPEWIIKGFIPKGEPTLISATGGVGKSMFSTWLSHLLAVKREFYNPDHGQTLDGNLCIDLNEYLLFDEFNIIKSGISSLFLQTENSNAQLNYRMRKIAGDNIEPLNRIFSPLIQNGSALTTGKTLMEEISKGETSSKRFEAWFTNLINTIQDTTKQKIEVVWLDPLISFCGCNENDNNEMRKNLDVLTKVSQVCNVTPVVIHHNSKNSKEYRGASAIFDWTRNLISLNRIFITEPYLDNGITKTRQVPVIEVGHDKCNVGKMFNKFKVKMNENFIFKRVPEDQIDPETLQEIKKVIQALTDLGGFANSQNELAKKYCELTGATLTTGKKYIIKAVEHDFITQENAKAGYSYSLKE